MTMKVDPRFLEFVQKLDGELVETENGGWLAFRFRDIDKASQVADIVDTKTDHLSSLRFKIDGSHFVAILPKKVSPDNN